MRLDFIQKQSNILLSPRWERLTCNENGNYEFEEMGCENSRGSRAYMSEKTSSLCGLQFSVFRSASRRRRTLNYVIELAFDPHNPPTEADQKQLQQAFEFINEGVRRIMGGEPGTDDLEKYTREVQWH